MEDTRLAGDERGSTTAVTGTQETRLLLRLIDLVLSATTLNDFAEELLEELSLALGATSAVLYLAEEDVLKPVAAVGSVPPHELQAASIDEGFAGIAAGSREPVVTQGEEECARLRPYDEEEAGGRAPVTAMVGLPLRHDARLVGVLTAETHAIGGFGSADIAIIQTVGSSRLARIIDRVRCAEAESSDAERGRTRASLSHLLMSTADPQERLNLMAQRLAEAAGVSRCFIIEMPGGEGSAIASAGATVEQHEAMQGYAGGGTKELSLGLSEDVTSLRPAVVSRRDLLEGKAFAEASEMHSALVLPLAYGGQLCGVALLDEPGGEVEFTASDVERVESVADVVALVTHSAQTQRRVAEKQAADRRRDRMSALHYVLNQARLTLEEQDLAELLPRGISDGLGYDRIIIYLLDDGRFDLFSGYFRRHEKDLEKFIARARKHPPKIGEPSIEVEVYRQGSPQIVSDPSSDQRIIKPHQKLLQSPSLAVVPIWGAEGVMGVLLADYKYQGLDVDQEDIGLLSILCTGIGAALENVRLYESARKDKDKLATLLENSDDAIVILDRERSIVAFNRASERLSGVKASDAVGKQCQQVWQCCDEQGRELDDRDCPVVARIAGRAPAEQAYTERILRTPGGTQVDVAATYAYVEGPDGEVEQAMTILRDLTEHKRWMRDHHIASTLQKALLPEAPPEVGGIDIGVFYESATAQAAVGGDFYDFVRLPDGRLAIVIGDVCGKGIDAAHHTAMAKYALRAYLLEGLAPSDVVSSLNDAVCAEMESGEFISLCLGLLDPVRRTLSYANAGHPHPLLRKSSEGQWRALEKGGMVLGVTPGQRYPEEKVRLAAGDTLLLYTDGLVETRKGRAVFGEDRLLQFLGKCRVTTAQQFVERVYQRSATYAGAHLADDVAIVAICL